ncbi:MAG: DNA translocase FtsK 4TM domain-containing protein [Candidatus Margulisiibacteriota bacterium]|jgi:S-DNA-T family DNA segregation ATPase FtsK/SpoIIIE
MPPKKSNNNGQSAAPLRREARKKAGETQISSKFKQDIIGILLIALALIIFISNQSSATGLVGLYVIKKALRSVMGVGIYVLPFFVALYGVIMLLRHEIKELAVRLTGLLVMFLVFISTAQFIDPAYFAATTYPIVQGAGGAAGFFVRFVLEKTVGLAGAYILLATFGFIALLLMLNLTFQSLISFVLGIFHFESVPDKAKPTAVKKAAPAPVKENAPVPVVTQLPLPESETEPEEEPKRKPVLEFPMPKYDNEADAKNEEETEEGRKEYSNYQLPPLDLLDEQNAKEKKQADKMRETTEMRKGLLEDALRSFGVGAHVVSIFQGPSVTRYELQPEPGVKVSRIANLADDIALNLAASGVRIEAPVPGKSVVGIEVPNAMTTTVRMKEIAKQPEFRKNSSKLYITIGKDLAGAPVYGDLGKMPHLLIAGTTGSGKSVFVNSLIMSILLRARPDEVKMLMIDPKMVELSIYDGIAHLLAPVVTDVRKASATLKTWVLWEMERRYKLFHDLGARNLQAYNNKVDKDQRLPLIVVIIDELADLMMVAANEVEASICRIAQMARATGIHLVVATQRPSVDVITGLIKANIPSRVAFAVATQIDSRVILDSAGAEKLLGRGDMLYNPIGAMKPTRVQGCFLTDKETERVLEFIKKQADPDYLKEITEITPLEGEKKDGEAGGGNGRDAMFGEVAKLIVETQVASTSYIQRKFRIGYNRAARLMDELQAAGIVSAPEGEGKGRRVLASRETLAGMGIQ